MGLTVISTSFNAIRTDPLLGDARMEAAQTCASSAWGGVGKKSTSQEMRNLKGLYTCRVQRGGQEKDES